MDTLAAATRAVALLALSGRLLGAQATVVGVVFDSLFTRAPMRSATVVIPELSRYVTSDDRGRFRFDSVPAGRYTMTFLHPSLDSLDIAAEVLPVAIPASGTVNTRLATPSPSGLVWLVCRSVTDTFPAMMLGHVRDADDSTAIGGATVTVTWRELTLRDQAVQERTTQAVSQVRPNGTFVLCGLPDGLRIEVVVEAAGRSTGVLTLAPAGVVRRHDFAIGRRDSLAATVSGRVRGANAVPVPRATVIVPSSTPLGAVTDDSGTFTLRGVPTGTQLFQVRHAGTWPAYSEVDIPGRGLRGLEFALGRRAGSIPAALNASTIDPDDHTGFDERRSAGIGRFVSAAEISARKRQSLAEALLDMAPLVAAGTTRTPSRTAELLLRAEGKPIPEIVFTPIVKMRLSGKQQCVPSMFLNGFLWVPAFRGQAQVELQSILPLASIRGIEVYLPSEVPPMFDHHDTCGSVVLWTR
ncbi:MAG: carboxypeptidase regulatory-like domain-containing protein [Gemmatimonadales bacterium]